jgi:hypothetical protein
MRSQTPLPGDHRPTITADPTADVLARVYALILSWPLPDPQADETRAASDEEAAE